MTREEKEQWDIFMLIWVIPALKNTWDEKKCEQIVEVLEGWQEHWIPISERLPEDGTYLVTLERFYGGEPRIDMRSFAKDLNKVDEFDFPKHKCGWYDYDSEYGYWEDTGVIAWMPLPEPYGPQESEEQA